MHQQGSQGPACVSLPANLVPHSWKRRKSGTQSLLLPRRATAGLHFILSTLRPPSASPHPNRRLRSNSGPVSVHVKLVTLQAGRQAGGESGHMSLIHSQLGHPLPQPILHLCYFWAWSTASPKEIQDGGGRAPEDVPEDAAPTAQLARRQLHRRPLTQQCCPPLGPGSEPPPPEGAGDGKTSLFLSLKALESWVGGQSLVSSFTEQLAQREAPPLRFACTSSQGHSLTLPLSRKT